MARTGKSIPKLTRSSENPVPRTRPCPIAVKAPRAVHDLDHSHQAALKEIGGKRLVEPHLPEELEPLRIEFCAGMYQQGPSNIRPPSPILNILVPGNDCPCPWLPYGQGHHFSHPNSVRGSMTKRLDGLPKI